MDQLQEERGLDAAETENEEIVSPLQKFLLSFSDDQTATEAASASTRAQLHDLLEAIVLDNRDQFIQLVRQLLFRRQPSPVSDELELPNTARTPCRTASPSADRETVLDLLHSCCMLDSADCAAALLNGEADVVLLANEPGFRGWNALHTAAEAHALRCVELLLKKHARTDLRTRDGMGLLAIDLSLCSSRMDVVWNPDEHRVEDLVVCLGQKDLTVVRLLAEKTKGIAAVAYAHGIEARVVPFTALLMVVPDVVKGSIMVLLDADSGCKEKTTIYECLIREALALFSGREDSTSIRVAKRMQHLTEPKCDQKRKLLLCEIELLHLSGFVYQYGSMDGKVSPPLILAAQAGDEKVIQLLLETNLEINDADAEGNTALHCCIKASKITNQQQMKIMHLLLKRGAKVGKKNKLGLTPVHLAAAQGNLEALQVLIDQDLGSMHCKTILQETPLFYAVENDRMECAELLLHHGASTEVFNLRRQRPIDMAKSQDMRFMLNSTNILLSKCDRQGMCEYAYDEEDIQLIRKRESMNMLENKRKIFVGGLPPALGSDSLGKILEEQFGAVESAIVVGYSTENEVHSRGFGFVVFKNERSASAAIQVHHITIRGKHVEIKTAIPCPRSPTPLDFIGMTQNNEVESNGKNQHQAISSDEIKVDETKVEVSWVDRVLRGQPKECPCDSRSPASTCSKDKSVPLWFRIFKKWLPRLLQESLRKGERYYPLSSVKGEFRAKFGMELEHAALGFTKLSEFIRSFPEFCQLKVVPSGSSSEPSNHMVLVPNQHLHHKTLAMTPTPPSNKSMNATGQGVPSEPKSPLTCITNMQNVAAQDSVGNHTSQDLSSRFLRCKPYVLFAPKTTGLLDDGKEASEGIMLRLEKHLVLEAIPRTDRLYSLFLRDVNFYTDYLSCISKNCCFACKKRKMMWANFPCQHSLWCTACKLQAVKAAETSQHKCVICDMEVHSIKSIPWTETSQPSYKDMLDMLMSTSSSHLSFPTQRQLLGGSCEWRRASNRDHID